METLFLCFSSMQKLSGHPKSQCEEALLKAIYQSEQLTSDITSSDVGTHTLVAKHRTRVRGSAAYMMVPCQLGVLFCILCLLRSSLWL